MVVAALVLLVLVVRQRFDPSCAAVECPDGYRLVDGAAQIAGSSTAQCCVVAYDAEAEADQQRQRAAEEAGEEAGDRAAALYGEAYRQTAALLALRMARAGVPTGRAIAKGLEQAKEEAELAEAMARAADREDRARAEAEASAAGAEASATEVRAFVKRARSPLPGHSGIERPSWTVNRAGELVVRGAGRWLQGPRGVRGAAQTAEIEVGPDTLTLEGSAPTAARGASSLAIPATCSDCCAGLV